MTSSTDSSNSRPFVVVAGFGAAGAAAAVSAAESGADVLVVDRAPEHDRGGSTRYNRLYMLFDDPHTPAAKFVDGVGGLVSPWSPESGVSTQSRHFWGLNPQLVRAWVEEAVPTVEWLEAMGLSFRYEESDITDRGVAPGVIPVGGGAALLDFMEKRALEKNVRFEFETSLVGVQLDDRGAVSAVVLESESGRRTVQASAVIMATGGFQGNQELMTRYIGPRAHLLPPIAKTGYYNRGEAIRLGLELGAATAGDLSDWHAVALDARGDGERWLLTGVRLGLLVNRCGERFVDESLGEPAVKAIRDQPDGIAFAITDARTRRHPFYANRFSSGAEPITAATIDELADGLGLPVHALRRTVTEYNAMCDWETEDGSRGTSGLEIPKSAEAVPVAEGPFEAWPVRAGMVFSMGGLKVDQFGRVLSLDDRPIPGLYAAGDTVGGYFRGYITYTTSIKALVLGRLGGAHAAGRAGVTQ